MRPSADPLVTNGGEAIRPLLSLGWLLGMMGCLGLLQGKTVVHGTNPRPAQWHGGWVQQWYDGGDDGGGGGDGDDGGDGELVVMMVVMVVVVVIMVVWWV